MPAWWSASAADFLVREPEHIVGGLATRLVEAHSINRDTQVRAWRAQVELLRHVMTGLPPGWHFLLEYPLLRLGRRIDAVVLTGGAILVLEFKVGATSFTNVDRQQVEDYALDLLDFHAESRALPIVPILVATDATPRAMNWPLLWAGVTPVLDASATTLAGLLRDIATRLPGGGERVLDPAVWEAAPYRPVPTIVEAAHLDVPVRSIRSSAAAPWVDAVLLGDATSARTIADEAGGVPFFLTRSLSEMRLALRRLARGTRRAGLVCSAGARRLVPDGIWPNFPHLDSNAVANWFLQRWPDVRASDALEVPATQFACQGLELDQVGLCWGNDLIRRPGNAAWVARNFSGTRWLQTRADASIAYQINTYRVLLTRARYETIIWVPTGDASDATRPPAEFERIAEFLQACGAQALEPAEERNDDAEPDPILL